MRIDHLYDRLAASCATINELNRLQLTLENRMTPQEATALVAHIRQAVAGRSLTRYADDLRILGARAGGRVHGQGGTRALSARERRARSLEWADSLRHKMSLATAPDPSPVVRRWLRGGAAFYQAGTSHSPRLAIGFTGNARRLMLPTPQFLQHLTPCDTDLLLLFVPPSTAYVDGVRGFSTDFAGTITWLAQFISGHGASRIAVVGTSGGALPAILAGHSLQAYSTLAVGTVIGGATDYARTGSPPEVGDVIAQYVVPGPTPKLTVMYGTDSALDAAAARSLAESMPYASVLTVEGSGHACLYPLAERGVLEDVLASTLFQELSTSGRAS